MEPQLSRVSVIVLNWNGIGYVEECVQSLLSQRFDNFDVIVIDNGSSDGSRELLKNKFSKRIEIVELPKNIGYAAGNNAGIKIARGDWIILFNNDAVADKFFLKRAFEALDKRKHRDSVGMIASKILSYNEREKIDNTGHLIYPDGLNRGRGRLERDWGQFACETESLFPSGCAGFYRKKMLDEIGMLDEDFFAYGEDADLGLRGRLAGWKCLFAPESVVYHIYSASSGAYSPLKAYYVERNRIWVLLKNFPTRSILLSPIWTFIRYLLQTYGAFSNKGAAGKFVKTDGKFKLAGILFKAIFGALRGAPQMLAKRKVIRKIKKISDEEFDETIKSNSIKAGEISLKD